MHTWQQQQEEEEEEAWVGRRIGDGCLELRIAQQVVRRQVHLLLHLLPLHLRHQPTSLPPLLLLLLPLLRIVSVQALARSLMLQSNLPPPHLLMLMRMLLAVKPLLAMAWQRSVR